MAVTLNSELQPWRKDWLLVSYFEQATTALEKLDYSSAIEVLDEARYRSIFVLHLGEVGELEEFRKKVYRTHLNIAYMEPALKCLDEGRYEEAIKLYERVRHYVYQERSRVPYFSPDDLLPDNLTDLIDDAYDKFFERESKNMLGSEALNEELLEALYPFKENGSYDNFGIDFLEGFVKQGKKVSKKRLKRYGLVDGMRPLENIVESVGPFDIWYDTTFKFVLFYDADPIANIGFDSGEPGIVIKQIQGREGKSRELRPIKWERALVKYTVDWAKSYGIPQVAIMPASDNEWVKGRHIPEDAGKLRYDITARRSGFKFDERSQLYVLHLNR